MNVKLVTFRKGDKSYRSLRWTDRAGKTHSESLGNVTAMSNRKAEQRRKALANDLVENRTLIDPTPGRIKVAAFLDRWLDDCRARDLTTGTLDTYNRDVKRAKKVFGNKAVIAVNPDDMTRFLNAAKDRGNSRASRKSSVGSIRAAFSWAEKHRMIPHGSNPFANPGIKKTQPKRMRIYTRIEVDAMIAVANDRWAGLIAVMADCGLRWSEALNLQPRDVTPPRPGQPTGWLRVTAKRPGPRTLKWEAKSHQERKIPLTREVWAKLEHLLPKAGLTGYFFLSDRELRRLLAHQSAGKLRAASHWLSNVNRTFGGKGRRGYLVGIQGRARDWLAQGGNGLGFDPAKSSDIGKVGLWERGSVHDLRRTYATAMACGSLPAHKLREYMGHASITTTMEFYVGLDADFSAVVVRALA